MLAASPPVTPPFEADDELRPLPQQHPHVQVKRAGSLDSAAARELFRQRLQKSELDFFNITGEPGDVEKDEEWAWGDAALTFQDVSFSVRTASGEEKVILEPISGHFEPGTLVAVMGPSGSGKTTLLDILAGKKSSPYGGTVHVNGRPRDVLIERMSAYVAQDDIMPSHLTVQEEVMFHQSLKQERPSKVTDVMFQQRVERTLEDLGLVEIKHSLIGDQSIRGISGGQRRRLSLACGLAAAPQIMFCDEPTSGLSATDAEACVRYMRLIAHKYAVTILVVIHQPRQEVAKLFDHLLLLTSGPGRCVYSGGMKDVPAYCARVGHPVPTYMNPTDFVMDLVTPGGPQSCEDDFLAHFEAAVKPFIADLVEQELHHERRSALELLEGQRSKLSRFGKMPPVHHTKYGVRFGKQLRILGARQVKLYLRDSRGIIADLLISVGKGVIVGLTYLHIGSNDAFALLAFFFMLMMAASIDGMKGIPKLVAERKVMKMETSQALYSEWAYIIPFTIASWLQALMANTIFIVVIFMISNLSWHFFGTLWWWTTLLYLTMDSMFLMLSAIAKDASSAMVMALPFFMLFLLFNGFTVSRATAQWYLAWLVDISPVAYAIEQAFMAAKQFYGTADYNFIGDLFGYRNEPVRACAVMVGVSTLFRFIQVLALKCLNNIQR